MKNYRKALKGLSSPSKIKSLRKSRIRDKKNLESDIGLKKRRNYIRETFLPPLVPLLKLLNYNFDGLDGGAE